MLSFENDAALWEEQYLLPGEDIYRIYEDSKHNLWIGTRMNGLYRRVNDRIEKIPLCPNGINGIIDPQIREFVEDDDGRYLQYAYLDETRQNGTIRTGSF